MSGKCPGYSTVALANLMPTQGFESAITALMKDNNLKMNSIFNTVLCLTIDLHSSIHYIQIFLCIYSVYTVRPEVSYSDLIWSVSSDISSSFHHQQPSAMFRVH